MTVHTRRQRGEHEVPPVRIDLPDGTSVTSDSSDVDRAQSTHFRRDVRLARVAADDFTIDQPVPTLTAIPRIP